MFEWVTEDCVVTSFSCVKAETKGQNNKGENQIEDKRYACSYTEK